MDEVVDSKLTLHTELPGPQDRVNFHTQWVTSVLGQVKNGRMDEGHAASVIGRRMASLSNFYAEKGRAQEFDNARKDALTSLPNRRALEERLAQLKTMKDTVFGIIILDADDYKKINDKYGHLNGDKVLVFLANTVSSNIRQPDETNNEQGDLVARYGGEEFVLVLAGIATKEDLLQTGEQIRTEVEKMVIPMESENGGIIDVTITVSLGGALSSEMRGEWTPSDLLQKADDRLYVAKKEGKNRSVITDKN